MTQNLLKLNFAFLGLVVGGWLLGLYLAPAEINQGEVYRLIYLHVPSAISAFAISFLLAGFGIRVLLKHSLVTESLLYAAGEVGLLFTLITLLSGSIWGRPTWGVWWTWDARLTTTFVLALLYAGFLLLVHSFEQKVQRRKAAALLAIFIALNVPIIYKSVTWWRTLHQPPTLLSTQATTISSGILYILLINIFLMLQWGLWLVYFRSLSYRQKLKYEDVLLT